MMMRNFSEEAQTGIRLFCLDVHGDELMAEDWGAASEAWAWLAVRLRVAQDRQQWFPKGKWATIQYIEELLLEEAKALIGQAAEARG
jgi:hypothetical protein